MNLQSLHVSPLISATYKPSKITDLRLQLLEPDRFPYLYKCLYGLLMLLPQSSAFATLKNRLNSVSAIGYLSTPRVPSATTPSASSFTSDGRPNRLKSRDDGSGANAIRWADLFEKFRTTQERQRRRLGPSEWERGRLDSTINVADKEAPKSSMLGVPGGSRPGSGLAGQLRGVPPVLKEKEKSRNPLGLGRFAGGGKKKK